MSNFRGWDITKTTNEFGEFWVISDGGLGNYIYSLDKYPTKDDAWSQWEIDLM